LRTSVNGYKEPVSKKTLGAQQNQHIMFSQNSNYAKSKRHGVVPDVYVQIDVKREAGQYVVCNLYTGINCVEMTLRAEDYKELVRKKFFIRDGQSVDSAGVLNTTELFIRESDLTE